MNGRGGIRPLRVVAACSAMLLATWLILAWSHAPTREQRSGISALALFLVLSLCMSAYVREGLTLVALLNSLEAALKCLGLVLAGLVLITPVLFFFGALGFWMLESVREWVGTRRAAWLVVGAFLLLTNIPAESDKGTFVKLLALLTLAATFGYWVAYRF